MNKASSKNKIQRAGSGRKISRKTAEQIDLQALAEEVYKLFKKEVQIERERRGRR